MCPFSYQVLKCAWGKNTARHSHQTSPALNLMAALAGQSSQFGPTPDLLSNNSISAQGVMTSLAAMSVGPPPAYNGSRLPLPPSIFATAAGANNGLLHPSLDPSGLTMFPAQMAAMMMMQAGLSQQSQQDALQSFTSALNTGPVVLDNYTNGLYGNMYGSLNGLPSNFT